VGLNFYLGYLCISMFIYSKLSAVSQLAVTASFDMTVNVMVKGTVNNRP
jgi:hypothetical protein